MGIIFDTNPAKHAAVAPEVVKAIDDFFDSLELGIDLDTHATIENKLSNMMRYADMNNRWSYKGSLTTPPCSKTVFFNVMYQVWPVKPRHLN